MFIADVLVFDCCPKPATLNSQQESICLPVANSALMDELLIGILLESARWSIRDCQIPKQLVVNPGLQPIQNQLLMLLFDDDFDSYSLILAIVSHYEPTISSQAGLFFTTLYARAVHSTPSKIDTHK